MLCLIIPCQDTFDDEEMTSEKLLQLENQKKKAKELQVQAMKDREEAELTVKIFLMKIIYILGNPSKKKCGKFHNLGGRGGSGPGHFPH